MARTSSAAVQGILMADYGKLPDGSDPSLDPFIESANAFTTQVASYALTYNEVTLSSTTLELIERWLAAHLYCMSDQPLSSKSTGRAGGSFQGQTGMGLKGTKYGQTAILMDYSRTLAAMDEGRIASSDWLGKPVSEQIAYDNRN